jgi:hypothetical protein
MSILSALALETAAGPQRTAVEDAWLRPSTTRPDFDLAEFIRTAGVADKALQMMEHHKNAAVRSLEPLQNVHLKSLLRRIVRPARPSRLNRMTLAMQPFRTADRPRMPALAAGGWG